MKLVFQCLSNAETPMNLFWRLYTSGCAGCKINTSVLRPPAQKKSSISWLQYILWTCAILYIWIWNCFPNWQKKTSRSEMSFHSETIWIINIPSGENRASVLSALKKNVVFRHSETTDAFPKIGLNSPGIWNVFLMMTCNLQGICSWKGVRCFFPP